MLTQTHNNALHHRLHEFSGFAGVYANAIDIATNTKQVRFAEVTGIANDGTMATDFDGQFQQMMQNIETRLAETDMNLKDLVHIRFYLTGRKHLKSLMAMGSSYLKGMNAAITTRVVTELVTDKSLVQADVRALRPEHYDSRFARIL